MDLIFLKFHMPDHLKNKEGKMRFKESTKLFFNE